VPAHHYFEKLIKEKLIKHEVNQSPAEMKEENISET
jgi:hypothetical protein